MELICAEKMADNNFAERDSVIFNDIRVLRNLLNCEHLYVPSVNYFDVVQHDIEPFMRKVVTTWMLEVCEEQMCEDQVFPLAVNYLDRFLCRCSISRKQLQLLGATTLLIASKIRQCHSFRIDLLCAYTDNSVTPEDMKNFEILVLSKLDWNIASITGFDYVDHIIERTSWSRENSLIRRHAHTLVSICCTELEFMCTLPSLVASACICAAIRGLKSPSASIAPRDICELVYCDPISLELVARHIEKIVDKETAAIQAPLATQTSKTVTHHNTKLTSDDLLDSQPETPTDIQDIEF